MKKRQKYQRKEPAVKLEDLQDTRSALESKYDCDQFHNDETKLEIKNAQLAIDNYFLKDKPRKSKREQKKLKKRKKNVRRY